MAIVMKIRYLGTGAAEGVPAMFCNCDVCKAIRKKGKAEFRTRTQVLLDDKICIDFPPEAYSHALGFGVNLSALEYLLVTHSHMDHFYAHDFILRGYKYASLECDKLHIFGNSEVGKVLAECTAREMKPEVACHIDFTEIAPYEVFEACGYRIIAIPATHSKTEDALLYYVEHDGKGYLHLYDTGIVCDKALEFLAEKGAKANLVSFDCTFGENFGGAGARHMGIADDMLIKDKLFALGVINADTKLVVTHFSHNCNPTRERLKALEEKYSVVAAYDGLEIDF